jgi:hypothetical protein
LLRHERLGRPARDSDPKALGRWSRTEKGGVESVVERLAEGAASQALRVVR